MIKRLIFAPVIWSSLLLIVAQVITLFIVSREQVFVEVNNFPSPQIGLGIPVLYFFGAVIVIGLALFFIPISILRLLLLILFAFIFAWGIFILLLMSFYLPVLLSGIIAVIAGIIWYFKPIIWLHNLLLLLALISVGLVFGYLLSPWAAMLLLLVIAVYDFVSVRLGHMMWMAQKLSESNVLPAFVIPISITKWNFNLKKSGFKNLFEERTEREFSLLGGGDVGFPLLLVVSVFFLSGYAAAIIIAAFSLVGLIGAYWVQSFFFKGKPTPAMPSISLACLIGFLITYYLL